jgi:hypothetical protein
VNLAGNMLCGIDRWGEGVYNADGIKAIADSIAVTASLTRVDVRDNRLDMQDKDVLRKAVEGRSGFELLL